jgi:hypothetical protein
MPQKSADLEIQVLVGLEGQERSKQAHMYISK